MLFCINRQKWLFYAKGETESQWISVEATLLKKERSAAH